nr:MAG TPA: hypothetical protein [Caudoviricetes sp.]
MRTESLICAWVAHHQCLQHQKFRQHHRSRIPPLLMPETKKLVAVALLLVVVLRCLPVLRATHQPLIPAVKRCLVSNRSH